MAPSQVAPGLPAAFGGQAVEIRRCDPGIVKLSKDDDSLARTIAIIRGTSAHVARQVPDDFFDSGDVEVEEFLPAAVRRLTNGTTVSEQLVVDFAEGDALAPYVTGDVVRILSAGTYFARVVTGTRPPASLVLDVALPAGVHTGMEVARLLPGGGLAANQAVAGARLGVTGLATLTAREGVAVTSAATVERRIVTGLVLDCTVAAVPAALQGVQPLPVAVVRPDPTVTTDGTAGADAVVTTAAGGAGEVPDRTAGRGARRRHRRPRRDRGGRCRRRDADARRQPRDRREHGAHGHADGHHRRRHVHDRGGDRWRRRPRAGDGQRASG